jgi:phosphatidylglycerol:prolipoprotein diacylglycerol transferase
MHTAIITIGIDPEIHLGPVTLTWHGLMIALGIVVGAVLAARWARARGLATDPLYSLTGLAAIGGIVGARSLYVLERGGPLLGMHGFTFFGGVILAGLLIAGYAWRERLDARYVDAAAFGLPLGVAVGRIADVINGEHYGSASTFPLAVRNSNPHALTPDPHLAYLSGGLFEALLGLAIFAIVWPLRDRVHQTGTLAWLVLGLFAVGRFFVQFARSDPKGALGLANAQWVSIALLAISLAGWSLMARLRRAALPPVAALHGSFTGRGDPDSREGA